VNGNHARSQGETAFRRRLAAIWHQRCPRCLQGRVYRTDFWRDLRMYYACPRCRVIYGRENGYFTGAMIVSYVLMVPIGGLLLGLYALVGGIGLGWGIAWILAATGLSLLPLTPTIFRYSRVIWMHFDRVVDSSLESERYVAPARPRPELPPGG
jgi:uncharacterized protein (DUF983 family)